MPTPVEFPPKIIIFEDHPSHDPATHAGLAKDLGFQIMSTAAVKVAGVHLTGDVRGVISPLFPFKQSSKSEGYSHRDFLDRARQLQIPRLVLLRGFGQSRVELDEHDQALSIAGEQSRDDVLSWLASLPLSAAELERQDRPQKQADLDRRAHFGRLRLIEPDAA